MPEVVVEFHLHQHVTGQEDAFHRALLAVHDLGHRLGGNHDAADAVAQTESLDAALDRLPDLALESGVGVEDVPLEAWVLLRLTFRLLRLLGGLFLFVCHLALLFGAHAIGLYCAPMRCRIASTTRLNTASTTKKNSPKRNTEMMTTVVVDSTSLRLGVTTLRISARTSLRKLVSLPQVPVTLPPNRWSPPDCCSSFMTVAFVDILLFPSRPAWPGIQIWQGRRD